MKKTFEEFPLKGRPMPDAPSYRDLAYGSPVCRATFLGLLFALFLTVGGPAKAAETIKLLVLGDSLVAGYGLRADEAFPAQLASALAKDGISAKVLNGGVSGDTSAGGLARLGWVLADKPSAAIVCLGANDALRGLDPAATRRNLDVLLGRLKAAGVKVLLAGMQAPPNMGARYTKAFNGLYAPLAAAHGLPYYPFFLDGVAGDPALNQNDGKHPTAAGVKVIVERMMPSVKNLLGRP
jgi:acyl-CoA thioesterase-1